ncbi:MAG: hypothetical protein ACFNVQ_06855 [Campylobacter sp.]
MDKIKILALLAAVALLAGCMKVKYSQAELHPENSVMMSYDGQTVTEYKISGGVLLKDDAILGRYEEEGSNLYLFTDERGVGVAKDQISQRALNKFTIYVFTPNKELRITEYSASGGVCKTFAEGKFVNLKEHFSDYASSAPLYSYSFSASVSQSSSANVISRYEYVSSILKNSRAFLQSPHTALGNTVKESIEWHRGRLRDICKLKF